MLRYLKTQSPDVYAYWSLGFLFSLGMHYFQAHPGGDGLQISFNAFSWIPISFFLGFSLFQIVYRSALVYSTLTLGLLGACFLLLLPLLYPQSADLLSLGKIYALAAGMLLFIGLQQLQLDEPRRAQLLLFVVVAVLLQAVLGYFQYFAWLPENVMGYTSDSRSPWGIFRQPNVMASFMATGLVLAAFLLPYYMTAKRGRERIVAIILMCIPLFTVPIILLLNSRVGWLGALIGSALALPYLRSRLGNRFTGCWLAMLLLACAVGVLLLANTEGGFAQASAKAQLDPVRLKMYPAVMRLILENAVFGVGYGNFESSFNAFAAGLYASGLAEPSGVTNLHHPHNELMYWAAEGGIVALAGLLLAAWLVLRTILHTQPGSRLVLIGLLFPIVLHTQTEYPFYHSAVHWVVFVLLIYLADSLGNSQKSKPLKSTLLFGTAGVVIPVVTTAFMATTLHTAAILNRYERVPGTSPEILLSILNPVVWRDRVVFTVRGNLMYAALAQNDTSQVQPFVDLLNESIATKPRWQSFQDLIFAYDFMNDREAAELAYNEAEYRFPTKQFYRLDGGTFRLSSYRTRTPESAGSAAR